MQYIAVKFPLIYRPEAKYKAFLAKTISSVLKADKNSAKERKIET